jgi:UDP-2,3-diacylglucosamine pyrophosphatase LpxH
LNPIWIQKTRVARGHTHRKREREKQTERQRHREMCGDFGKGIERDEELYHFSLFHRSQASLLL